LPTATPAEKPTVRSRTARGMYLLRRVTRVSQGFDSVV
jgi:hypothetical protein